MRLFVVLTALIVPTIVVGFLAFNHVDTFQPPSVKDDLPSASATPTAHPKRYLIRTEFIPQAPEKNWEQPWQDACEEAAILTVYYYYQNIKPSLPVLLSDYQALFKAEADHGWGHDLDLNKMAQIAQEQFKLKPLLILNPTADLIKTHLLSNSPVIIPANGKILFQENKNFTHGGPWYHNLVILGFDDVHQQFIVHDVGTRKGAYYRYSYQTLIDSIHDFPSTMIKEDINSGAKQALVLLK